MMSKFFQYFFGCAVSHVLRNFSNFRKADALIGGFDDDKRARQVLYISQTYLPDDMTWCTAIARPRDLWSNIFRIFQINSWVAILTATFAVAAITKHLVRTEHVYESYVWAYMLTISAILGKPTSYEPSRVSIRVMVLFLYLFGLIISTSFCTFLISTLTQPRLKHQIDNLPEAVAAGFKFASGTVGFNHYQDDNPVRKRIISNGLIENNI